MESTEIRYAVNARQLSDGKLREEWRKDTTGGLWLETVRCEMARRFLEGSPEISKSPSEAGTKEYYTEKLIDMAKEFGKAYYAREWARAKFLFDSACTICAFLEEPEEIWKKLFGSYNEQEYKAEDGLFPDEMRNRVMKECIIKNRLGFECMVYRVPGEAGYYGAKENREAVYMPAEENPAYSFGG